MEFVPHGMAPSPPGAAPLRVQAAAAASLLAEGVLPEDVGAAAGLANPKGGEYTPRVLADLADAIRAAAVSAAISSVGTEVGDVGDGDGGTQPGRNAHAAWSPGGDVGVADYRDSTNAAWWDPESLATLLCATHRADGALQSLDGFDLATVVDALVTHHEWSIHDVGDLLWCIHTAQTVDTTVKNNTHNVTMARVTELADVAIDLSRRESLVHGGFGWSKRDVCQLFPRALPAPDWDGGGVSGLSAVEGCALLAAALAGGGTRGTVLGLGGDGFGSRDDDDVSIDSFASDNGNRTRRAFGFGGKRPYPRFDDTQVSKTSPQHDAGGWSLSDISFGLRQILDEPSVDSAGGVDEEREETTVGDDEARRKSDTQNQASSSSSSDADHNDAENNYKRRETRRTRRRRQRLLGATNNSNHVGYVNNLSRRGVAGAGGGGVARHASVPSVGPDPQSTKRNAHGGWDARSVARLAATLHGAYGWCVDSAARLAADALGWEGRSPAAVACAAATIRLPDVGWNAENASVLVTAMVAAGNGGDEGWDGAYDISGFVSPMCDALVEHHGWTPLEVVGVLEHLQVWSADDAGDLIKGLQDWAEGGIAKLLAGVMEWRRRDRNETAVVVRVLIDARGWDGGGVLGKLLGVGEGEALLASVLESSSDEDEDVGGVERVRRLAAGLAVSGKPAKFRGGGGGGGGDHAPPHVWPPDPPLRDLEGDGGGTGGPDGYSADAD